jgi:phospholipid transport system substrate-binding protein
MTVLPRLRSAVFAAVVPAVFVAVFLAVFLAAPAIGVPAAHASPQEATVFMQNYTQRAMAVMEKDGRSREEQIADFRSLLSDGFALGDLARFILGDHAAKAEAREIAAFTRAFETMLVERYAPLLAHADAAEFEVGTARGIEGKSGQYTIETRISLGDGAGAPVLWRVKKTGDGYRILDIMAEGISMAVMLRDEYQAVMQGGGVPDLTDRLRALNARR